MSQHKRQGEEAKGKWHASGPVILQWDFPSLAQEPLSSFTPAASGVPLAKHHCLQVHSASPLEKHVSVVPARISEVPKALE